MKGLAPLLCGLVLAACGAARDAGLGAGPGEQLCFQLSYLGLEVGEGTVSLGGDASQWEVTAHVVAQVAGLYRVDATTVDALDVEGQSTALSVQQVDENGASRRDTVRIAPDGAVRVHREPMGAAPSDELFAHAGASMVPVGALYSLRARPLAEGEQRALRIFNGTRTITLVAQAVGKVDLKTPSGVRRVTEVAVTGALGSIAPGPTRVFFSDDDARLPVRLESMVGPGTALVEAVECAAPPR